MDNFSITLSWHPGYHISRQPDKVLLLVGETESFLLQGWEFHELFCHIDSQCSTLDMISRVNGFGKKAILLHTIEELIKSGLIRPVTIDHPAPAYQKPDFTAPPRSYQFHGGQLELTNLSHFDDPVFLGKWAERISVDRPMGIVIADDYLDPRLKKINRHFKTKMREWLIIKPTGSQPLIGPFFTPEKPGSPCLECLAARMIHNQPVRKWLQNDQGSGPLQIPVLCDHEKLKKIMDGALEPVKGLVEQKKSNHLFSLDPHTLSLNSHFVSAIPQCPNCGEPDLTSIRNQSPITLRPCPKLHISDGGVRTLHPATTLERLQPSISPVTGIISKLSPVPGQNKHDVPIYQSFFFKTPGPGTKPDNQGFVQVSLGKGLSHEQSQASALCESIERHASQYRGDEYRAVFAARDAEVQTILPQELSSFSEIQYRRFADAQHPESQAHYAVKKYLPDHPLAWTRAWSLADGIAHHVPLSYCYANTPFGDQQFIRFNSNGCAAGNTLEEALLQGFLELVERDATAIWWYNRIRRPGVSLHMLTEDNRKIIDKTLAQNWEYWVLDITHDFEIPVMTAVARHKKDKTFRLGFGCHINPVLACQRALTELCQLIAINGKGARFDFNHIEGSPFLFPVDTLPLKRQADYIGAEHADIKNDIHYCLEKATQRGLKTLAIDCTRPDVPIHTVRAIVPGLCHIWPQFGNRRLYAVPVHMGWTRAESDEDRLNPLPLVL